MYEADYLERIKELTAENERLRRVLADILGMASAFEHAVKAQPYTRQSAEFVFKQAREVLNSNS